MIHREFLAVLKEWASNPGRKPLVLRGARQVGKTTVVIEFAREFDNFIHLNLERKDDAVAFEVSDNINKLLDYVCLSKHIQINEGRTLIFIDEIQNSPKAVALLRYFYEERPDLYVIAAGSRLQSLLKERVSFPVGRVEYKQLRPCSFVEFLSAIGEPDIRERVLNLSVDETIHAIVYDLFNEYSLIGGMPEVVARYADNRSALSVQNIYHSLLKGYNEDVEKYAKNEEQVKVLRHILKFGWQWAGEAISFSHFGGGNYSSTRIHEAMDMLQKAFIINLDYPVTSSALPMLPSLKRSPKLIFVDNGIVNFSAGIQSEYMSNTNLLNVWRGKSAEQMVAQELRILLDKHYAEEQFFWVRDKAGSRAEVDFIWQFNNQIIPIEVKNGHNAHLRSIHSYIDNSEGVHTAVRVWNGPFSIDQCYSTQHSTPFNLINLPFYYVGMLDTVLATFGGK